MAEVLERGSVYFFYRPRVNEHAPRSEDDVQRFHMVLSPEETPRFRLVRVGRKHMPDAGSHGRDRAWAYVERLAADAADVELELRGYQYTTKTRGERDQPSARPAGEGRYAIARHDDHTHLAYALLHPADPGPVQRDLGIRARASYIVVVRNPWWPSPPGTGLSPEREAAYPDPMQERFRGRRFAALEPAFLDREGAELILIGAHEDPEGELGIALDPGDVAGDGLLETLGLDPVEHPVAPLFRGDWA
jgi:hypothetical protein